MMTGPSVPASPQSQAMADALLAARLLACDPAGLGGLWLRGGGPARDRIVETLAQAMGGRPMRRMPGHIDDDALLGGLDIAASLAAGRSVMQQGLLSQVAGGVMLVPMAERMNPDLVGRIGQGLDNAARQVPGFGMVLLDDGVDEEMPPQSMTERVGFHCDLSAVDSATLRAVLATPLDGVQRDAGSESRDVYPKIDEDALTALAATALALGVDSGRAMVFAVRTAVASAALAGRETVAPEDVTLAARLVLGPRATCFPAESDPLPPPPSDEPEPPPDDESEPPPGEDSEPPPPDSETQQEETEMPSLDDLVLEAAKAAIPPDLLARIGEGRAARRAVGSGGAAGQKRKAKLRGRPKGALAGVPRGGNRLALIDTLRSAAPWQEIRRQQEGADAPKKVRIRKNDLRIRRFEQRAEALTIFAVDASGSSAIARLSEAKGAVELMLAQAYVKRAQVALIAFRGTAAELLLPPTRSLARARRVLSELPGGGGTPLALGISAACDLAEAQRSRGRTPFLAMLTDGKANISASGAPGRPQAAADAMVAARRARAMGLKGVVIDISPRPQPEAEAIARAMGVRYLALPRADSRTVQQAVSVLQFETAP